MEFIFDLLGEIIVEPIIEGYVFAMAHFSERNKKVDEEKIKCIVVFECVALMLMFIIGGAMLLETDGESVIGKALFIFSIAVSVIQILLGIILNKKKKDK